MREGEGEREGERESNVTVFVFLCVLYISFAGFRSREKAVKPFGERDLLAVMFLSSMICVSPILSLYLMVMGQGGRNNFSIRLLFGTDIDLWTWQL